MLFFKHNDKHKSRSSLSNMRFSSFLFSRVIADSISKKKGSAFGDSEEHFSQNKESRLITNKNKIALTGVNTFALAL